MIRITMLDTTGREPETLATITASSMKAYAEFLEIIVTDPMQETILRGKLIEFGVPYTHDYSNPTRYTVDLATTDFEFRAEADTEPEIIANREGAQ